MPRQSIALFFEAISNAMTRNRGAASWLLDPAGEHNIILVGEVHSHIIDTELLRTMHSLEDLPCSTHLLIEHNRVTPYNRYQCPVQQQTRRTATAGTTNLRQLRKWSVCSTRRSGTMMTTPVDIRRPAFNMAYMQPGPNQRQIMLSELWYMSRVLNTLPCLFPMVAVLIWCFNQKLAQLNLHPGSPKALWVLGSEAVDIIALQYLCQANSELIVFYGGLNHQYRMHRVLIAHNYSVVRTTPIGRIQDTPALACAP